MSFLKTSKVESLFPPQGRFMTLSGIKIHYIEKGEGHPVVLLHGSFGSVYDFTMSIFSQAADRFRVIALDRPGYGYSGRFSRPMSVFDHLEILREGLKNLGVEKPVLVAHSSAASIALAYSIQYPQEVGAVLTLGGYLTPFDGKLSWIYRLPAVPVLGSIFVHCFLGIIVRCAGPERLAAQAFSPNPVDKDYAKTSVYLASRPRHYKSNAEDVRHLSPSLRILAPRISEIQSPWIFLTGDKDSVALPDRHAKRLQGQIKNSKLIVLKDTGHQPHFSRPAEVLDAITEAVRLASNQSHDIFSDRKAVTA